MEEGLAEVKARDGDSGPPLTAPKAPEALLWLRADRGWVRESSSQWAEGSRQPGTPLSLPEKCQAAWSVALQRRATPRGDRRGHRKGAHGSEGRSPEDGHELKVPGFVWW